MNKNRKNKEIIDLHINIPSDLKQKLKLKATSDKKTLTNVILSMIKKYVNNL